MLHAHGLALSRFGGQRWTVLSECITASAYHAAAAKADLVFVTVTSAATEEPLRRNWAVRSETIVVSFQNGIGNADILRASLLWNRVLEGMVSFNVVERGLGAFHQGSGGELKVLQAAELQPFIGDFASAGLPLSLYADMLPVQWAKLLLNLNNAINALVDRPLKEELSQRPYRLCLAMAQKEALRLLRQVGSRPACLTAQPAK